MSLRNTRYSAPSSTCEPTCKLCPEPSRCGGRVGLLKQLQITAIVMIILLIGCIIIIALELGGATHLTRTRSVNETLTSNSTADNAEDGGKRGITRNKIMLVVCIVLMSVWVLIEVLDFLVCGFWINYRFLIPRMVLSIFLDIINVCFIAFAIIHLVHGAGDQTSLIIVIVVTVVILILEIFAFIDYYTAYKHLRHRHLVSNREGDEPSSFVKLNDPQY